MSIVFDKNEKWIPAGMVYVALSRCLNYSGLWVKELSQRFIKQSEASSQLMKNIEKMRSTYSNRVIGEKCYLKSTGSSTRGQKRTIIDLGSRSFKRAKQYQE